MAAITSWRSSNILERPGMFRWLRSLNKETLYARLTSWPRRFAMADKRLTLNCYHPTATNVTRIFSFLRPTALRAADQNIAWNTGAGRPFFRGSIFPRRSIQFCRRGQPDAGLLQKEPADMIEIMLGIRYVIGVA